MQVSLEFVIDAWLCRINRAKVHETYAERNNAFTIDCPVTENRNSQL
jgi:hypothetical protein